MQASAAAAAVSTLLRALHLPAIGTHWVEQGGIFAGLLRGRDGAPDTALIVAADPAGHLEGVAWGQYGQDIPGAASHHDGRANTQAMAQAEPASDLAARILALDLAGHRDWYLASADELRLAKANVPELFSKDDWYWSSTQYSPYRAWVQDFEYGSSDFSSKDFERRAVAVRRLAL